MVSISVKPADDQLTRPLGLEPARRAAMRPGSISRPLALGLGIVVAGAVGYTLWFGDRSGGIPVARVPITEAPVPVVVTSAGSSPSRGSPEAPLDETRRDARRVESDSGVTVTRPAGSAAPNAVIVTVPDTAGRLRPAPDERVAERTRFGLLPKAGPDGVRAAELYARPMGRLPNGAKPAGLVAILVGGLGISQIGTADAIAKLPPDVTLAFAPYGPGLDASAASAREAGHEIMLQVPMEPFDYPDSDPGPHTLTVAARPAENLDHLRWALGRFVGYTGVVNYMGAKLTADSQAVGAILREIDGRGLTMVDDGSSSRSRVLAVAAPGKAARADAVIDAVMRPEAIDTALQALESTARQKGVAVGSATAFPLSVQRISQWSATLAARGILLVPVSAAVARMPAERPAGP